MNNHTPVADAPLFDTCVGCRIREHAICKPVFNGSSCVMENLKAGDRIVTAGADLFVQGEPLREVFTVVTGWVMIYQLLEDGRRQITRIALPGDFIGFQPDMELPMDRSAQALTDCRLCVFSKERLLELFREEPAYGMRLIWIISEENALARELVTSLGRRSARERIGHFLLSLYARVRTRCGEPVGETIPLPLTQEHLGDALGLTSVHVNRTLRALKADGLIEITNRKLHILDPDRLAELRGFEPLTENRSMP